MTVWTRERLNPHQAEIGEIRSRQRQRLQQLFEVLLQHNRFYREKLSGRGTAAELIVGFESLPTTSKSELIDEADAMGAARNLTWPRERYVRYHRTSGTRGRPLVVLDTAEDWAWWCEAWQPVLDAAGARAGDRALLAFSFGPFIGFWSAFEAVTARGLLVAPAGGLSTLARLELIRSFEPDLIFCTPSYALHLAEQAERLKFDPKRSGVRTVFVAGEPGGSIPEVRERITASWGADVLDHAGASESGPWGFGDASGRALVVNEEDFVAEFLEVGGDRPVSEGELGELVLTTLGRFGAPVLRYRTGDLVRHRRGDRGFVRLEGGVLGRVDDMVIVRGVNVFPSSVEAIVRQFPEVVEFQLIAYRRGAMDALRLRVEDRLGAPQRISEELERKLGLRVDVELVEIGSLPRSDGKAKRFIDERSSGGGDG